MLQFLETVFYFCMIASIFIAFSLFEITRWAKSSSIGTQKKVGEDGITPESSNKAGNGIISLMVEGERKKY